MGLGLNLWVRFCEGVGRDLLSLSNFRGQPLIGGELRLSTLETGILLLGVMGLVQFVSGNNRGQGGRGLVHLVIVLVGAVCILSIRLVRSRM